MTDREIKNLKYREYYARVYKVKKLEQSKAWQRANRERYLEYQRSYKKRKEA